MNWFTKKYTSWQAYSLMFFIVFASGPIAKFFFFDKRSIEVEWPALLVQLSIALVGALIAEPAVAAAYRRFRKPPESEGKVG